MGMTGSRLVALTWGLAAALVPGAVFGGEQAVPDAMPTASVERRLERMKNSANFEGGRFVNEVPTSHVNLGEIWWPLKDQLFPGKNQRPARPLQFVRADRAAIDTASGLKAIWLGHSTVLVRIDGVTLLLDPVFDDCARHALGSAERFQPPPLLRDSLPAIDAVIVSHDHYDHLEQSTIESLAPQGVVFFVPLGVGTTLEEWRVPDTQIVELDWWESARIHSLEIICTPAKHFSGRKLSGLNKSLWASWTVVGSQHRVFYGGDTGYSDHFERLGERYGPFDLTIIPIGAYDEAWPDIHLRPEEAVSAHRALRGDKMLPVHWGTFDLAAHPWDEPIDRLVEAAAEEGIEVLTPRPGEIVDPDQVIFSDRWWGESE